MFSFKGVANFFLTVVVTMCGIYLVKLAAGKFNIPVLGTIAEGV